MVCTVTELAQVLTCVYTVQCLFSLAEGIMHLYRGKSKLQSTGQLSFASKLTKHRYGGRNRSWNKKQELVLRTSSFKILIVLYIELLLSDRDNRDSSLSKLNPTVTMGLRLTKAMTTNNTN